MPLQGTHISFHGLVASTGSVEGARSEFQQLISQIVHLRHPNVRQVQANPGDWGIDCFVGDLTEIVAVWQAKFFIHGVGQAQEQEIRESFDSLLTSAAREGFDVSVWTLCIPVSMDAKATKWWDRWKRKAQALHGIQIELWDETELQSLLLAPDCASVRAAFFGNPPQREYPVRPLPDDVSYDEMLFIRQLRAASLAEVESAKREFFNAELVRREVADKGVESEIVELEVCGGEVHALWETRFNERCEMQSTSPLLPGLYPDVRKAIEVLHYNKHSAMLPIGLVHRLGTMHQIVDRCEAGWVRNFRDLCVEDCGAGPVE